MNEKVYSSCGEIFNDDSACYDNGDTYWSGNKVEIIPSELVSDHDVSILIENMVERLYERVGDVAEGSIDASDADKKALLVKIQLAVDMLLGVNCFGVDSIEEHVMSDEE